jgi:two-component system LytT family sensor kinase
MNFLYEVTDTLLIWQTVGCLMGLCVSVLLVRLVHASWSFESQRRPSILLSAALILWNFGGLANGLLIIGGFDYESSVAKTACAIGYTGLCFLTGSVLGIWELHIDGRARRLAQKIFMALALAAGVVITTWLWMDAAGARAPLSRTGIRVAAEANLYVFVLAGMLLALWSCATTLVRLCAAVTLVGTLGPLAALAQIPIYHSLPQTLRVAVSVYAEQSVNYVAIAAFLLIARLRYTDTLVEEAFRVISAILAGSVLWGAVHSIVPQGAALAFAVITVIAALALLAPSINSAIRRLTERIFQQPDFCAEVRALAQSIAELPSKSDVLDRAERVISRALSSARIRIVLADSLPQSLTDLREFREYQPGSGAIPLDEVPADAVVPVVESGRAGYAIALARSKEERGFLASEVSFLSNAAHCISARLEALTTAQLRQQTMEAELRALRAQVNPHFLFNALNTIADLIVVDAGKAERMTERLSDVFRYVLTHSQKTTITVREEIEFVRRYLEIEEARFRDRLQTCIHLTAEAAEIKLPALLLQPIVENAIKHGLAPKLEGGSLTISASSSDSWLLLTVEDNGVGLAPAASGVSQNRGRSRSTGTGLANTSERLRTLYGDQAQLVMESPNGRGCRVTIRIPEFVPCAR